MSTISVNTPSASAKLPITSGRLAGTVVGLKGIKDLNAQPQVTPDQLRKFEYLLYYHLTQGFDRTKPEHVNPSVDFPIRFIGAIEKATRAQRSDWDFGILGFAKIKTFTMRFEGLRAVEGAIDVNVTGVPGFRRVTLDTPYTDQRFPFNHYDPTAPAPNPHLDPVIIRMRDHPNGQQLMRLVNQKTNYFNYLTTFDHNVWFSILLSARSRVGGATHWIHLAHTTWEVRWNLTFRWRSSKGNLVPISSAARNALTVSSTTTAGAPADREVSTLLGKLNQQKHADRTNVVIPIAIKRALEPANRTDSKRR